MGVLKLVPGISAARLAHLATIDVASLPGDYYPYEYWIEEGVGITGPAASPFGPGPTKIDTDVIHYGAGYYPNGVENINMVQHLRATNRDYTFNRGYSIGYNHFIDAFGNVWEARGWRIRNAANSTVAPNFNVRSMSMHVVVSKTNSNPTDATAYPANAAQAASLRWYRREQKRRAGFELALLGHRDTKPTGCPGSGIYHQIWHTDDFDITESPVVVEPPVEPPVVVVPPSSSKPVDSDLMVTIWQGTDCAAEFIGMVDKNGNALEIRWIQGDPKYIAARDAHIAAGGRVERQPLTGRRFQYVVLHGPVPYGDSYAWSEADFLLVKPDA
jgi:hypothetical protein